MRNLAVLSFLTLDGVMQGPGSPDEDPSSGFTRGGWARPYWHDVMEQVMREAMASPYDLLLGRNTYEMFAAHFSDIDDDPVAVKLNEARKYVVSSSLTSLRWRNSEQIKGDTAIEVLRLKEQDGPLLQVHGSWQLVQTLLSHGLIDEFRLWIFPVLIGHGKRLFEQDLPAASLKLIKTEPCPSGAVMQFYNYHAA